MNGIAAAQIHHQPQITQSPSLPDDDHASTSTTTTAAPKPQIQPDNNSAPQQDLTISTNTDQAPIDAKTPHVHPVAGPAQSEQAAVDESKASAEDQWSDPAPQLQQQKMEEVGEVMLGHINGQIELVEHQPDTLVGSGDSEVVETHEFPTEQDELKRVKVYELIGSRWMDQGTAFCYGEFKESTSEAVLIARAERNLEDIILSTTIRSNDVYQRQQDTLIVWTEPDGVDYALSFQDPEGCLEVWTFILDVQRHMNNSDDHASSPLMGPDGSVTTASIIRSGHLPQPQLGIIGEIEKAIKTLARTQQVKERICEYIQQEDYIKLLIEVMNTAEDLESLENLHALCSLMQTILMLNDHSLYEHVLEDDIFFGVVGMLEYDPDFPGHKANYREFLHQTSRFHQPIPIREPNIQRKIHHTYRLQFLKDVVLARALDDSTFNVLNSCIIFNQIDIITHVQQDGSFLRDIVKLFVDDEMLSSGGGPRKLLIQGQQVQPVPPSQGPSPGPNTPPAQHMVISLNSNGDNAPPPDILGHDTKDVKPEGSPSMNVDQKPESPKPVNGIALPLLKPRPKKPDQYAFAPPDDMTEEEIDLRREVVMLVQQLCVMGKNVQLPARMALFRTLVDRGILFAVQWALNLPEKEPVNKPMIGAAGEILSALLDHDLNGVRSHVLKQVVAIEKERDAKKKGADKAETILEMISRIMATSRDLAVQSQVGDALKVWLDVPSTDVATVIGTGEANMGAQRPPQRKDDAGTERYMDYFYKECITILLKPLLELSEWKNITELILSLSREETNRYVYLCDMLHNFILQHHFRSHFFVMSTTILTRVASLLKAKDKHLRHAAFRIFRLILKQNNNNMHAQIMKYDILKPILDLTVKESRRDNLLSCSCQEFFENMRRENMKELIRFCMTRHEPEIRELAESPLGGQRFELLIRRYEMNNEPPPPEEAKSEKPLDTRGWPSQGRPDTEEDDYFNNDDDDDDQVIPAISQQWARSMGVSSPIPGGPGKRKRRAAIGTAPKGYRPPLRTPSLGSLVDYDDDEDTGHNDSSKPSLGQGVPSSKAPAPVNTTTKQVFRHIFSPSGPPPKRAPKEDEDDEDNLLEALVRPRARSQSPAPAAQGGPIRMNEKRRRNEEDDDDELLERLTKVKKQDLGSQKETAIIGAGVRAKNGDDPPKKIKLKFSPSSLSVATVPPSPSTTPVPSEPSAKDGDTG